MTGGPILTNPYWRDILSPATKLHLLARSGVELRGGTSPGWHATVGECTVSGRNLQDVVETAVVLLALRRDLWPRLRLVEAGGLPETSISPAAWEALAHNGD